MNIYKSIIKQNKMQILDKLNIDLTEILRDKIFNTLMLHCDGLISIWVKKRIDVANRKPQMVLMRIENNGYRYCIGYLKEYDKSEEWNK
jgi:hypothetical protein